MGEKEKGLRKKIGYKILRRKMQHLQRQRKVTTLESAQKIGLIFNATETSIFDPIKNFIEYLTNKNIEVFPLGIVNSNTLVDQYLFRKGYYFLTRKQLNWYYKPTDPYVETFINQPFDILIDLSIEQYYPIQYLAGLSKAKFKIGIYSSNNEIHDFMINIDPERKLRKEVKNEIETEIREKNHINKDIKKSDMEVEVEKKVELEIETTYLIEQIKYYVPLLKIGN
jgi:hypothetical protein